MTGTPPWAGEDRQFLALAASHSDRRCRLLLLNRDNFARKGKAEGLYVRSRRYGAARELLDLRPPLGHELRGLVADQREVIADQGAADRCLWLR
jgi:hypothetical protein